VIEFLKDWLKIAAISAVSFSLFVLAPFGAAWLLYQLLRWGLE
jgi:hypothetical protein